VQMGAAFETFNIPPSVGPNAPSTGTFPFIKAAT
jgi:hypothetical protein